MINTWLIVSGYYTQMPLLFTFLKVCFAYFLQCVCQCVQSQSIYLSAIQVYQAYSVVSRSVCFCISFIVPYKNHY